MASSGPLPPPLLAGGKSTPHGDVDGEPRLPYFCFGMDIGGSLCKLVYFQRHPPADGTAEPVADRAYRELLLAVVESREA